MLSHVYIRLQGSAGSLRAVIIVNPKIKIDRNLTVDVAAWLLTDCHASEGAEQVLLVSRVTHERHR